MNRKQAVYKLTKEEKKLYELHIADYGVVGSAVRIGITPDTLKTALNNGVTYRVYFKLQEYAKTLKKQYKWELENE